MLCRCCAGAVQVLCRCCAGVVQVLCRCCAGAVQVLCRCCAGVVQVLCRCCAGAGCAGARARACTRARCEPAPVRGWRTPQLLQETRDVTTTCRGAPRAGLGGGISRTPHEPPGRLSRKACRGTPLSPACHCGASGSISGPQVTFSGSPFFFAPGTTPAAPPRRRGAPSSGGHPRPSGRGPPALCGLACGVAEGEGPFSFRAKA